MFPRHKWKNRKITKHVDTVVNSIQPLSLSIEKTPSNPHKNTIPPVDFYKTNLLASSCANKDVVYNASNISYDCTTSYRMDSVILKINILCIGNIFFLDPLTPLRISSSSVIRGITNPLYFSNMDQNDSPIKNYTQFQSSKMFPNNSIYL